jgi:hypothetical protein
MNILTEHDRPDRQSGTVPFTDEQKANVHRLMDMARTEGANDVVERIIAAAAAAYFERNEARDSEAEHLSDIIWHAMGFAEAGIEEPEDDLFASTNGDVA